MAALRVQQGLTPKSLFSGFWVEIGILGHAVTVDYSSLSANHPLVLGSDPAPYPSSDQMR